MQPGQRELAARVAAGVRAAGGTPLEFNTIAISDNLTQGTPGMRASLVSRELIADSVELVGLSQPFDGLVCIGGCDKTVPGLAMGLLRLDVPGLILYSGAMAAGSHRGAPVTIQDVWEAVGAHEGGRIDDEELEQLERDACPGFGACTGHFTANTMAVAIDFLGLGPIGLGSVPAADPAKGDAAEAAGAARSRPDRPRRAAVGARHPRVARERDRRGHRHGRLDERRAPPARDRERGGRRAHARGLRPPLGLDARRDEPDAGRPLRRGRPPSRRRHRRGRSSSCSPTSHADAPTVDGRTLAEHAAGAAEPDGEVIAAAATPFKPGGALRVLRGNLAPEGAVVKLAGHERPVHRGPARTFDSEAACKSAIYDGWSSRARSSSFATRARPARPGCRRCSRSPRRSSGAGSASRSCSSPTAASAARRAGLMVGHVAPEAARGGPIALVRDGDSITIDVDARTLDARTSTTAELAETPRRVDAARAARAAAASSPGTRAPSRRRREARWSNERPRSTGRPRWSPAPPAGSAARSRSASPPREPSSTSSTSTIPPRSLAELPARRGARAAMRRLGRRPQIRATFSRLDRLDVLVNCAGVTGLDRCAGSERGDLGPRDRHEPEGDVLLLESRRRA